MDVSEKERADAQRWYLYHGVDLKKCHNCDEEDRLKSPSLWRCGTNLGTIVIAVCDTCHASYDVTDYDAW